MPKLNEDEQAVLDLIRDRLKTGQKDYGKLRLQNDTRNFNDEALEEVLDAAIYLACELERRSMQVPGPSYTDLLGVGIQCQVCGEGIDFSVEMLQLTDGTEEPMIKATPCKHCLSGEYTRGLETWDGEPATDDDPDFKEEHEEPEVENPGE